MKPVVAKTMSPTQPSLPATLAISLLVGSVFLLVTIVILLAMMAFRWWLYEIFYIGWLADFGGFPCMGVFAITSASYVVARFMPTRYSTALLMVSGFCIVGWFFGVAMGLAPEMHKTDDMQWLRPAFILWLTAPPWIPACLVLVNRFKSPTPTGAGR